MYNDSISIAYLKIMNLNLTVRKGCANCRNGALREIRRNAKFRVLRQPISIKGIRIEIERSKKTYLKGVIGEILEPPSTELCSESLMTEWAMSII